MLQHSLGVDGDIPGLQPPARPSRSKSNSNVDEDTDREANDRDAHSATNGDADGISYDSTNCWPRAGPYRRADRPSLPRPVRVAYHLVSDARTNAGPNAGPNAVALGLPNLRPDGHALASPHLRPDGRPLVGSLRDADAATHRGSDAVAHEETHQEVHGQANKDARRAAEDPRCGVVH